METEETFQLAFFPFQLQRCPSQIPTIAPTKQAQAPTPAESAADYSRVVHPNLWECNEKVGSVGTVTEVYVNIYLVQ